MPLCFINVNIVFCSDFESCFRFRVQFYFLFSPILFWIYIRQNSKNSGLCAIEVEILCLYYCLIHICNDYTILYLNYIIIFILHYYHAFMFIYFVILLLYYYYYSIRYYYSYMYYYYCIYITIVFCIPYEYLYISIVIGINIKYLYFVNKY